MGNTSCLIHLKNIAFTLSALYTYGACCKDLLLALLWPATEKFLVFLLATIPTFTEHLTKKQQAGQESDQATTPPAKLSLVVSLPPTHWSRAFLLEQ
jgi:hypothetical protein